MVKIYEPLPLNKDGTINIDLWIQRLDLDEKSRKIVRDACLFSSVIGEDRITRYGISCFAKGLETAEILSNLNFDPESIAAAIVYNVTKKTEIATENIEAQLGSSIANLVENVYLLSAITELGQKSYSGRQINNIRKMLLAMVRDVRVVVIKLAERLCVMRKLKNQDESFQQHISRETMDILAPLANRLGLHRIKWELEDLSFLYLDQSGYMEIAKNLAERRIDREKRVKYIIDTLTQKLKDAGISSKIDGRAKHIYSIKRKMQRKKIDLSKIYDAIAVRILVPSVHDCYEALSIVHENFQSIPEEFDDYIATPKPNGYQSIHTALYDNEHKTFEVQIRTYDMHSISEKGVAAHWMYKEGKQEEAQYEQKITWLRNLLEWQKELTHDKSLPKELEKDLFEDRIYVFTPKGDIVDLINGSTPLDFAYYIHTDIGHRCRGAKVNDKIVPLTYKLKTCDRVEIITQKQRSPSRDWILIKKGYLKTPSARAKVLQWFKKQDYAKNVEEGRDLLEHELRRLHVENVNFIMIANKLDFKSTDMMFASLGRGDLRLTQIVNLIQVPIAKKETEKVVSKRISHIVDDKGDISISGVGHLLSHIAKCCKPIPGDPIVGYITQTRGITIHRKDCSNIISIDKEHRTRLVEVEWKEKTKKVYSVDIEILVYEKTSLIHEITKILYDNNVNMISFNTFFDKKNNKAKIILTLAINDFVLLDKILNSIKQIPEVYEVKRLMK